jgi:hypothetical protein
VAIDLKYDPFADEIPQQSSAKALSIDQLLEMRAQIDAQLPIRKLKDMDLEQELVLQVQSLQVLQRRVMDDMSGTPANQIAQCASSLSSALMNLVKMQSELHTSERLKKIESILIECVKTLPVKTQTAFFDAYEKALGA